MPIGEFLFGTDDKFKQFSTLGQPQRQGLDQLFGSSLQQLLQGGGPGGFAPIAQQEMQRFQQDIIPSLAERFTSMGSGAQRSSGFNQALGGASTQLGTNLAALGAQHQLAQRGQALQGLQLGLTPQTERFFMPGRQGFMNALAPGLGQGIGMGLTGGLGGAGAVAGAGGGLLGALSGLLRGGQ